MSWRFRRATHCRRHSTMLQTSTSNRKILSIFARTMECGRPVNPLTGLDSNQSHAFPLSARPLALGRNALNTPRLATMDFRILKYFPFGGAKRLDVVAEFFNLFNSANTSQINPVFGSGLTPIPGFRQPIAGTGARQIQFSLDFEF